MIQADLSSLRRTGLQEYLVRFVFGGAATVLAALIAKHFGPVYGGLFLAFPAIFPASVTLVEAHEKKRKAEFGHDGTRRGRMAASIDASGAMAGCIGLAGFALVLWRLLPLARAWLIMLVAMVVWGVLSIAFWKVRKARIFGYRIRALR